MASVAALMNGGRELFGCEVENRFAAPVLADAVAGVAVRRELRVTDDLALDGSGELARSFPRWIGFPSRVRELHDSLSRVGLPRSGRLPS
jgi:hypothetical protein